MFFSNVKQKWDTKCDRNTSLKAVSKGTLERETYMIGRCPRGRGRETGGGKKKKKDYFR